MLSIVLQIWFLTLRENGLMMSENAQRSRSAVAAQSKAWTIFARANTEVAGSDPTQGMESSTLKTTRL
jgi:hypothetical protein